MFGVSRLFTFPILPSPGRLLRPCFSFMVWTCQMFVSGPLHVVDVTASATLLAPPYPRTARCCDRPWFCRYSALWSLDVISSPVPVLAACVVRRVCRVSFCTRRLGSLVYRLCMTLCRLTWWWLRCDSLVFVSSSCLSVTVFFHILRAPAVSHSSRLV